MEKSPLARFANHRNDKTVLDELKQMQQAGEAMLSFAREKVGDEEIDRLIESVPALRQLL